MKRMSTRYVLSLLSALNLGAGSVRAQAAPKPGNGSAENNEDDTTILSPFVVDASEDQGYLATSTLAGSRVRTELKDTASSISVYTKEFMRDIGATNNQTLLAYTTNTEVGGLYGNFAGVGSTFINGASEGPANLLRPQSNTRVRGLDSADNTRDYFLTDIPWDGFNIGRVDMQRGPNSILFGVGSPAGIINASVNTAGFKTEGRVENRFDRFGSMRNSFDYNQVVLSKELSVRVAAVDDYTKYRQQPAFNRDRRLFGAVRWDPKLFGPNSSARTSVRAYYEYGRVTANRPRSLPPIDRLTPFFDADKINKQFFDSGLAQVEGIYPWRATATSKTNFWIGGDRAGANEWSNPVLYYNNTASPSLARQGRPNANFSIKPDGTAGGSFAQGDFFPVGILPYGSYATQMNTYGPQNNQPASVLASVAGAQGGFYKDKQITDTAIYDFYNNLLDGPTKKEWQDWKNFNISLDQTFFNDRLGFQVVYDRQNYRDGSESNLGWSPSLSIDILKNNLQYPGELTDMVVANPNAGRVYVSGNGNGNSRSTDRENIRFTAFGELRARDYLGDGLLARILGHHTITGLYSKEKYDVEDRSYARYAVSDSWASLVGEGPKLGDPSGAGFIGTGPNVKGGSGTGGLRGGDVILSQITYLTGNVVGFPSASQLHIPRISVDQVPPDTLAVSYFDSHWKYPLDPSAAGYVDPNAPWTNPVGTAPSASTQSFNPANYVGWRDTSVTVLNADKGDINSLYKDASKKQQKISSKGGTWQAYLWDDVVVGTVGWRSDTVKVRAGYPTPNPTGALSMDYGLAPQQANGISTGSNTSWGVVVHTPKKFRDKLPWGTDISLGFNNSNNARVENRYGFDGEALPNARGHSRDYSLAIRTLNDRLTFKATYYDTTVKDANISSVTTDVSTLGSNSHTLRESEAWGTGSMLMDVAGLDGHYGADWYWNWANTTGGYPNAYNNAVVLNDPAFLNNPETIKEKAAIKSWQDQMLPQSWFDAFGYDINVAKAKAGDYNHAIQKGAWVPDNYVGSIQTPGAGKVNGLDPTGTVDNESKGWEFEIVGNPTKNWDVSVNASKQHASQTALGAKFAAFIEMLHTKYMSPAGDLRRWWGGDEPMRNVFNREIWAPYLFQKETSGKLVPEMSPWRFNFVNNYRFDKNLLKGVNVGIAYRWQQASILGYGLNQTQDNLDVNKPLWGSSQDWLDLWTGYERKITTKINWRIQLNVNSVGKKPRLSPISIQPDGNAGQYRIEEGMTWTLTNTFSF